MFSVARSPDSRPVCRRGRTSDRAMKTLPLIKAIRMTGLKKLPDCLKPFCLPCQLPPCLKNGEAFQGRGEGLSGPSRGAAGSGTGETGTGHFHAPAEALICLIIAYRYHVSPSADNLYNLPGGLLWQQVASSDGGASTSLRARQRG